jgi:hypothetical protein
LSWCWFFLGWRFSAAPPGVLRVCTEDGGHGWNFVFYFLSWCWFFLGWRFSAVFFLFFLFSGRFLFEWWFGLAANLFSFFSRVLFYSRLLVYFLTSERPKKTCIFLFSKGRFYILR